MSSKCSSVTHILNIFPKYHHHYHHRPHLHRHHHHQPLTSEDQGKASKDRTDSLKKSLIKYQAEYTREFKKTCFVEKVSHDIGHVSLMAAILYLVHSSRAQCTMRYGIVVMVGGRCRGRVNSSFIIHSSFIHSSFIQVFNLTSE